MAEAWLRHLCELDGLDWTVGSAGLDAFAGDEASLHAQEVIREAGGDLSHHAARRLTAYLADEADLIAVMTASHRRRLIAQIPDVADKTFLLMHFSRKYPDSDVPDPFMGTRDSYEKCFLTMKEAVENLKNSLIENNQPTKG